MDGETVRLLCNDLVMWRQWSQAASIAGYDLAAKRLLVVARQLEKMIGIESERRHLDIILRSAVALNCRHYSGDKTWI